MTSRTFTLPLLTLFLTLPLLTGCAAAAQTGPVAVTVSVTPTTEAVVEPTAEPVADPNCLTVSAITIASIQNGVAAIDAGNMLTRAVAYKAGNRANVYFIAGEILGAGMKIGDTNALWATNGDPVANTKAGVTLAVDGAAKTFSDWGSAVSMNLSQTEPGAEEAIACLEALQK